MDTIKEHKIKLPDYCLSYVFNGDDSGISEEDKNNCDDYLKQFYQEAEEIKAHIIIDIVYNDIENNYVESHFTWNPPFGLACNVTDCIILLLK